MNRVGTRDPGRRHHRSDIEVRAGRIRGPNTHSFIGQLGVKAVTIRLRVDSNGRNAHLATGGNDPHRNFAAIGNQYFRKHLRPVAP